MVYVLCMVDCIKLVQNKTKSSVKILISSVLMQCNGLFKF